MEASSPRFDYEIRHIEGSKNIIVDSISRLNFINDTEIMQTEIWNLMKDQIEDNYLMKYIKGKKLILNKDGTITDNKKWIIFRKNLNEDS